MGSWYRNCGDSGSFNAKCVHDTRATYPWTQSTVDQLKTFQYQDDGGKERVPGKARVQSGPRHASEVTFPSCSVSTVSGRGRLLVIALGPSIAWAVVGHPTMTYGWCCRVSPRLAPVVLAEIIGRIKSQGLRRCQFCGNATGRGFPVRRPLCGGFAVTLGCSTEARGPKAIAHDFSGRRHVAQKRVKFARLGVSSCPSEGPTSACRPYRWRRVIPNLPTENRPVCCRDTPSCLQQQQNVAIRRQTEANREPPRLSYSSSSKKLLGLSFPVPLDPGHEMRESFRAVVQRQLVAIVVPVGHAPVELSLRNLGASSSHPARFIWCAGTGRKSSARGAGDSVPHPGLPGCRCERAKFQWPDRCDQGR